jgi:hypothetical protein
LRVPRPQSSQVAAIIRRQLPGPPGLPLATAHARIPLAAEPFPPPIERTPGRPPRLLSPPRVRRARAIISPAQQAAAPYPRQCGRPPGPGKSLWAALAAKRDLRSRTMPQQPFIILCMGRYCPYSQARGRS